MQIDLPNIQSWTINRPLYVYQTPMVLLTTSVVMIVEDAIVVVKTDDGQYKFPGGQIRTGQETIQFSAVRQFKEQTGILVKKDSLFPVDFRSAPERSQEGNIVDIGMITLNENLSLDDIGQNVMCLKINFDQKKTIDEVSFYMDHDLLFNRALDIFMMMQ